MRPYRVRPSAGPCAAGTCRGAAGLIAALSALVVVAGCMDEGALSTSGRNLVVVGDSLSAGHQNGCTITGQQEHGFAKLIANQAGWRLDLPLIGPPGARPCMEILTSGNPATIQRMNVGGDPDDPATWGMRVNPAVLPNNLGMPGTRVVDAVLPVPPDNSFHGLFGLDYAALWKLFLDTPERTPDLRMVDIAVGLLTASERDRDVVLFWLGSNDTMWSAIGGTDQALTPPEFFEPAYLGTLGALAATGAELVVANLPDLTAAPHFMAPADAGSWAGCPALGVVLDPGTVDEHTVVAADRLTLLGLWKLKAICDGVPGAPALDNFDVLTAAEFTAISDTIAGYNAIIAGAVAAVGAASVDIATLFADAVAGGYPVGAETLTTAYCGGIVSLDGLHPTHTGHAVVANAFIAAMNRQLGYAIPPVDVVAVRAAEPAKNKCLTGP